MELTFSLHPKQAEVYNSPARFKVVPAGRQSGKTHLAVAMAITETLRDVSWGGVPLTTAHEVAYIYPTFEQGKKVVWPRLKAAVEGLGCLIYENTGLIVFPNGRRLRLLGADNPDSLRGFTWSFAILDEYKDMGGEVFDEVCRPALSICQGGALFIGTPKGKNHFYLLYLTAMEDTTGEYAAFTFSSSANPFIAESEIASMSRTMSAQLVAQELKASFVSNSGTVFKDEHFIIWPHEPAEGSWVITADLAGFSKASARSKDYARRDESAIAVTKVTPDGWWTKEIIHGRWEVRETALRIFSAAKSVQTMRVGIEKGMAFDAVMPYLTDLMRQYSRWLDIVPLSHGNQRKLDRIQWSLQGRGEKGKLLFSPGPYYDKLVEQALDFPDSRTHDDLLDALSYVDQMATTVYMDEFSGQQGIELLDPIAGY